MIILTSAPLSQRVSILSALLRSVNSALFSQQDRGTKYPPRTERSRSPLVTNRFFCYFQNMANFF